MTMTIEKLAALVIQVLDLQKDYFKAPGPRKLDLIGDCKAAERHLRKVCDEILHPPQPEPPGLFDNPKTTAPAH